MQFQDTAGSPIKMGLATVFPCMDYGRRASVSLEFESFYIKYSIKVKQKPHGDLKGVDRTKKRSSVRWVRQDPQKINVLSVPSCGLSPLESRQVCPHEFNMHSIRMFICG